MALQKIERIEWRVFCDRMSKSLVGKRAEIEIASPQTGVHLEARWLPVWAIGLLLGLKLVLSGPTNCALAITLHKTARDPHAVPA
jgi:hypothetical protein